MSRRVPVLCFLAVATVLSLTATPTLAGAPPTTTTAPTTTTTTTAPPAAMATATLGPVTELVFWSERCGDEVVSRIDAGSAVVRWDGPLDVDRTVLLLVTSPATGAMHGGENVVFPAGVDEVVVDLTHRHIDQYYLLQLQNPPGPARPEPVPGTAPPLRTEPVVFDVSLQGDPDGLEGPPYEADPNDRRQLRVYNEGEIVRTDQGCANAADFPATG